MIRVILAEDHAVVRAGIQRLIEQAGDMQVVAEATTGDQVLDTLRAHTCDVLLLDITLPGQSGLELLPHIQALPKPPAVLMLSMHDEPQIANRALKLGASGYATKAGEPALLIAAVRKLAAGGRYIDPTLADRLVFEVGLGHGKPPHAHLSEREFQVFLRLAQGAGVNDVAEALSISAKTVSTHKVRLMQKLNLQSTADLVRYALEHKLLE